MVGIVLDIGKHSDQKGETLSMDERMLKLAQDEYLRQYESWLRGKPNKKSIVDSYEQLIKLIEKYCKG